MPASEESEKTLDDYVGELQDWLYDTHHEKIKFFMNMYYITSADAALMTGLLNIECKAFEEDRLVLKNVGAVKYDSLRVTIKTHLEVRSLDHNKLKNKLERHKKQETKKIEKMDNTADGWQSPIPLEEQLKIVNFYMEIILGELRREGVISRAITKIDNDDIGKLKKWGKRFVGKREEMNIYTSTHGIYRLILSKVLSWQQARRELALLFPEILDKARSHAELLVEEVIKDTESLLTASRSSSKDPKRFLTSLEDLCCFMIEGDSLNYQEACQAYHAIEAAWNNACDFHELKNFLKSDEKIKDKDEVKKYLKICKYFANQYAGDHRQGIIDLIVDLGQQRGKRTQERWAEVKDIEYVIEYLEDIKSLRA